MSRRLWLAIAFTGAAVLTYLFFRPSHEERIRQTIATLAEAVGVDPAERDLRARHLRIRRTFQRILAPSLRVDIAGLVEDVHDRDELAAMATSAAETYSDLTVTFGDVHVEIGDHQKFARVASVAALAGTDHEGHRARDELRVVMGLENVDGAWRIVAFSEGAPPPP